MSQDNILAALKPFADAWDEYVRDGGPDGKASAEILFRPDSEFIAASEAMKPKPGPIPECSACGTSRLDLTIQEHVDHICATVGLDRETAQLGGIATYIQSAIEGPLTTRIAKLEAEEAKGGGE